MIKAKVSHNDLSKLVADLGKLNNLTVPMRVIGNYMLRSINKNFQEQGRPKKWKSLSSMTLNLRKGVGKEKGKILQVSGRLKNSITFEATKKSVCIGTNLDYAQLMQEGGTITSPAITIYPRQKRKLGLFVTQSSALRTPLIKRVLKFRVGGKDIYCKKVNMPRVNHKVPARPFVLWQDEDIKKANIIINDFVKETIKD